MSIIARQEEIDGKHFTWIITEGFNTIMVEDDHKITEEEAQTKLEAWQQAQLDRLAELEELEDGSAE